MKIKKYQKPSGSLPKKSFWWNLANQLQSAPSNGETTIAAHNADLNRQVEQARKEGKSEDEVYKRSLLGTLGGMAVGQTAVMFPGAIAKISAKHPMLMRTIDIVGNIDSARNLISNNGISKTIRKINEDDTWGAIKSGAGDILDLTAIGDTARLISKLSNKGYRAYHAYNTIVPYGYNNAANKAKNWISGMLLEKKYSKGPDWINSNEYKILEKDALVLNSPEQTKFAKEARQDAWALYLRQPQQFSTYIKNPDGTFAYNPKKLNEVYKNNIRVSNDSLTSTLWTKADAVGFTHGGLWKAQDVPLTKVNDVEYGNLRIEDLWDLQPFERKNLNFSNRLNNELIKRVGTQHFRNKVQKFRKWMYDKNHWSSYSGKSNTLLGKITKPLDRPLNIYRSGVYYQNGEFKEIPPIADKIINKFSNNIVTKKIDTKLKNLEVGKFLGGKPFYMKSDIPYMRPIDDPVDIIYGWSGSFN